MTSISEILGDADRIDEELADAIQEKLDGNLEVPDHIEVKDNEPSVASDNMGDWIVWEFEVTPDRAGEIYLLNGAFTLQMYDGEDFLTPSVSVDELNEQLASI
jgi:hypothetical protein